VILKGNCNLYRFLVGCAVCFMHLVQMLLKTCFFVIDAAVKDSPTVRLLAFLLSNGT